MSQNVIKKLNKKQEIKRRIYFYILLKNNLPQLNLDFVVHHFNNNTNLFTEIILILNFD